MIRRSTERLGRWFNSLPPATRKRSLLLFCLLFLLLAWLSIRFIRFDGRAIPQRLPVHIGSPSGTVSHDTTNIKN